ncbi:MAG TPA: SDR family oxidoreductase [Nitrososphaeraceae archaeon]
MEKENNNTILVTGSTGTVGSEVVKQLASLGKRIKAAVHTQNKADKFKDNSAIDMVNIDYHKPETVADAFNNVDKLFLVTLPSPDMTDISSNVVKEAKKNEIKHIVKLSVLGADTEPETMLGRVHRQEEKLIEDSGLSYTFLRAGAFMQNFVTFFGKSIREQNTFYLPTEEGKVGLVDVRDIASAAVAILSGNSSQYEKKAYGITGQEALSYSQAAEILSKELGRKISFVNISEESAHKAMKEGDDVGLAN